MRKQNKRDPSRASLGNDEELISSTTTNSNIAHNDHHTYHQNHSPTVCAPLLAIQSQAVVGYALINQYGIHYFSRIPKFEKRKKKKKKLSWWLHARN